MSCPKTEIEVLLVKVLPYIDQSPPQLHDYVRRHIVLPFLEDRIPAFLISSLAFKSKMGWFWADSTGSSQPKPRSPPKSNALPPVREVGIPSKFKVLTGF